MKKILIYVFAVLSVTFTSCSNDETTRPEAENTELTSEGIKEAMVNGIAKGLRIDFTQPTTFNYTTEIEKDSIIKTITKDIFEINLNSYRDEQDRLISDEFAVNILINETSKTIIAQPELITQVVINSNPEEDDNKKCGGKEGDGWKSYGLCTNETCVEGKMREASNDYTLVSGKCLDIRIKRNTFNARVCARVVNC